MRVTTNSCTAAAPSYGDIFHSRNSYYPYEENTLTKFVHTNFTWKRFSIEAEREETPFLFPGIITCEILFLAHEIKIIISRECVFKGLGEKSHSTFKFSVGNGYKASVTLLNSSSVCSIEFFDFDNFLLGCKPQGTSIILNLADKSRLVPNGNNNTIRDQYHTVTYELISVLQSLSAAHKGTPPPSPPNLHNNGFDQSVQWSGYSGL